MRDRTRCQASRKTTEEHPQLGEKQLGDGSWVGRCPECGAWVRLHRKQTMEGMVVRWRAHYQPQES